MSHIVVYLGILLALAALLTLAGTGAAMITTLLSLKRANATISTTGDITTSQASASTAVSAATTAKALTTEASAGAMTDSTTPSDVTSGPQARSSLVLLILGARFDAMAAATANLAGCRTAHLLDVPEGCGNAPPIVRVVAPSVDVLGSDVFARTDAAPAPDWNAAATIVTPLTRRALSVIAASTVPADRVLRAAAGRRPTRGLACRLTPSSCCSCSSQWRAGSGLLAYFEPGPVGDRSSPLKQVSRPTLSRRQSSQRCPPRGPILREVSPWTPVESCWSTPIPCSVAECNCA